jgi:hypothetical protein
MISDKISINQKWALDVGFVISLLYVGRVMRFIGRDGVKRYTRSFLRGFLLGKVSVGAHEFEYIKHIINYASIYFVLD